MNETVDLVHYRDDWPVLFRALGRDLRRELDGLALRIDHIGSTSVPRLPAKDIIDVQISVASFVPLDAYGCPLSKLGFEYKEGHGKEGPDLSKRYFRERSGRETHIHVVRNGSWAQVVQLLLRDHLRESDTDRRLYERSKWKLADECGNDRDKYNTAKRRVIWEILERAHWWSQKVGWFPGPTDA
jgi:GrpB-like predicted nucleotidyltransferase (UPF0157 family)